MVMASELWSARVPTWALTQPVSVSAPMPLKTMFAARRPASTGSVPVWPTNAPKYPPQKASPAPVGSITSVGIAGTSSA